MEMGWVTWDATSGSFCGTKAVQRAEVLMVEKSKTDFYLNLKKMYF